MQQERGRSGRRTPSIIPILQASFPPSISACDMPRRPNVCFLLSQEGGKRTRRAARATLNSPSEKRRPGSRNGPTFRRCFREECAYKHKLKTNCWHLFSPRAVERFLAFLQAERKTAFPTDGSAILKRLQVHRRRLLLPLISFILPENPGPGLASRLESSRKEEGGCKVVRVVPSSVTRDSRVQCFVPFQTRGAESGDEGRGERERGGGQQN